MEVSSVDGRLPQWSLIIGTILSASIAIWMGYEMVKLPFWGWRPLFLELAGWGCILFPFYNRYSKHDKNQKLLLAASLSGFLFAAAFPPSPLTPLIFIAWIPLIWVEHEVSKSSTRTQKWMVWKYAFHAFLLWNVISTFWVVNTALLAGLIANILNAIIMATVFMLYHVLKHYVVQKWHGIILTSLWISFEYLHMFWDITWPWLTLGNTFAQYPSWVQWYEFTGVFGGSAWVFLVNYLLYQLYVKYKRKEKVGRRSGFQIAVVLFLPFMISFVLLQKSINHQSEERPIEVAVVQPNYEPHYQKFEVPDQVQMQRVLDLSDSIVTDQTEYLVLPETVFSYVMVNELSRNRMVRQLSNFVDQHPKLNLVTGLATYRVFQESDDLPKTVRKRSDGLIYDVQNSAIEIEANDPGIELYFKSKLVPGAEFFPFKSVLPFIEPIVRQLGGSMGHATQPERSVFSSEAGRVAPVICYESIYGAYVGEYVRMGATMIFILTNDGWWDDTPGHLQHLAFSSLRAIEHRRPIARSANTGVSAFVTSEGKILDPTEYEVASAIRRVVTPRSDLTFYSKWGDYIARLAVALTLLLFGFTFTTFLKWRSNTPKK